MFKFLCQKRNKRPVQEDLLMPTEYPCLCCDSSPVAGPADPPYARCHTDCTQGLAHTQECSMPLSSVSEYLQESSPLILHQLLPYIT